MVDGDTIIGIVYMFTMAAKYSHHVALTAPLAAVRGKPSCQGDYASVSEVVRAGLRLLIEQDEDRARARAERGCHR